MYGLEDLKAINAHAKNRVVEVPLSSHAEMEQHECIRAAIENLNSGAYTYAQYIEELAEIRNTYQ